MTRTKRIYNLPSFYWYRAHFYAQRDFDPRDDGHAYRCMGRCPLCRDDKAHNHERLSKRREFLEIGFTDIAIGVA